MNRRRFLAYGGAGAAALSATGAAFAQANPTRISLRIEPVDVELIDGRIVYMLLFYSDPDLAARPVLRAVEGATVTVKIGRGTALLTRSRTAVRPDHCSFVMFKLLVAGIMSLMKLTDGQCEKF
jgi:hypothetical protein